MCVSGNEVDTHSEEDLIEMILCDSSKHCVCLSAFVHVVSLVALEFVACIKMGRCMSACLRVWMNGSQLACVWGGR